MTDNNITDLHDYRLNREIEADEQAWDAMLESIDVLFEDLALKSGTRKLTTASLNALYRILQQSGMSPEDIGQDIKRTTNALIFHNRPRQ